MSLRRFLTYVVVDAVNPQTGSRLGGIFGVGKEETEEEVLGPVFARLGEEDMRHYRKAAAAGFLWESAKLLNDSFVVKWAGAALEEVMAVADGAVGDSAE